MRLFDVTILVLEGTKSSRIEERINAEDFHEACVTALSRAIFLNGRVLAIVEFKQPPRLVS